MFAGLQDYQVTLLEISFSPFTEKGYPKAAFSLIIRFHSLADSLTQWESVFFNHADIEFFEFVEDWVVDSR